MQCVRHSRGTLRRIHNTPLRATEARVPQDADAPIRQIQPTAEGHLRTLICKSIRATGPLSISSYMALCLSHPNEGYYTSKTVLGASGDFITSPEVSQIFGELLALWYLSNWQNVAVGTPIRMVELGPGRGTLLKDMIRTFSQFPQSCSALKELKLVEMSPLMRKAQADTLPGAKVTPHVEWVDQVAEVEPDFDGYTMIMAHEFFDALPVNIFEKRDTGFHELRVDITNRPVEQVGNEQETQLRYALDPSPTSVPLSFLLNTPSEKLSSLPTGTRLEISPLSYASVAQISKLLKSSRRGGSALIIDYGKDAIDGDTFRAFRSHKQVHPLDQPGSADLTASVNFELLKMAASQAHPEVKSHGPLPQGKFLSMMGLDLRLDRLLKVASTDAKRKRITEGAQRLIDDEGMGGQYSVLGLTSDSGSGAVWPFVGGSKAGSL